MKTLTVRLGTWGAALGMLAGAVELSVGAHIRPWIGNKENPFVLGVVTLVLSGLAWMAIRTARYGAHTANRKLATILGVLVPAGVCFTTVGRLWYLPGILLSVSAALLIAETWRNRSRTAIQPWRWVSGLGALVSLLTFAAAFWREPFGLFWEMALVRSDRLLVQILPMDVLRRTVYAFGVARAETFESTTVMVVYLLLALGAGIALSGSLASSRLFTRTGGGMSLAGLLFFVWRLPAILLQANYQSMAPLWRSLGWGWYSSLLGTALILLGAFLRETDGENARDQNNRNAQPAPNKP